MKRGEQARTSLLHELLNSDGFLSKQPLGLNESWRRRIPDLSGAMPARGREEKTHVDAVEEANEPNKG